MSFHADGEVVKFDGFLKLYIESKDNVSDEDENELLPDLTEGEIIEKNKIIATQHFSKPHSDFLKLLVKNLKNLELEDHLLMHQLYRL